MLRMQKSMFISFLISVPTSWLSSDSTLGMRLLVITGIWICSAKISLGHTIIFWQPDILRTRQPKVFLKIATPIGIGSTAVFLD
jgi:hypothetical protein